MNETLQLRLGNPGTDAPLELGNPGADAALGTLTLVCFLVGVPGNLLATTYFVQEHINNARNVKKLFFTELYISMASIDLLLTATLFPIFENYFHGDRLGYLFNKTGFCFIWGFIWEIVPCISVFLVGFLSIARMLILIRPMQSLNLKVLRSIIGSYFVYHLLMRVALILADTPRDNIFEKISYTDTTGYCFYTPKNDSLWYFNAYHAGIVLGLPVVPISLSFFASIFKLRERGTGTQNFSRVAQTQATVTIIIVTSVYLVCNLPVFINYIYYTDIIMNDDDNWTRYFTIYKEGTFMGHYIWNITYCVLVALNGAINPLVFYLRMRPFREFIKALWPIKSTIVHSKAPHMPGKSVKEVTTSSF